MTLLSRFDTAGYYKKVLIAICLCVAVLADSGVVAGRGLVDGDRERTDCAENNAREAVSTGVRFECFNDFIVPLKDSNRKDRILVCDVVIELNQGMKLPKERAEIRKIIYKICKGLSCSSEIRKRLRETIKINLNNFMDNEITKNVYITRFILL